MAPVATSRCGSGWNRHGTTAFLVRPRAPRPGIAGGSEGPDAAEGEAALRHRVRDMLRRGELPSAPGRLWAGKGSGRPCAICRKPIEPRSVEFETDGASPLVVHRSCHTVWMHEAARTR